ncbi:hypothetical protein EJ04DRAFT_513598 [Polyplosphaeria fusca]|uniref:Uncharacterized protein n=1 Tax=Polyplosphaeria fusca TaxID=682080 RepID=A0A9P4QSE2_9PLEO|nr:hypothetical protein EJ04DRAFT_513598 [Polyplosphaeria fusca]
MAPGFGFDLTRPITTRNPPLFSINSSNPATGAPTVPRIPPRNPARSNKREEDEEARSFAVRREIGKRRYFDE